MGFEVSGQVLFLQQAEFVVGFEPWRANRNCGQQELRRCVVELVVLLGQLCRCEVTLKGSSSLLPCKTLRGLHKQSESAKLAGVQMILLVA